MRTPSAPPVATPTAVNVNVMLSSSSRSDIGTEYDAAINIMGGDQSVSGFVA